MKKRRLVSLVLAAGLCGMQLLAAADVLAADCKDLRAEAMGETSLLKKRDLLEQAVAKCPQDSQLNFNYAKTLERLRKYDEALKYYKVASGYEDTRAIAFFGMGDIYAVLSKPEQAVAAYEKGLDTDPTNERARNSMDELKKKHGIKGAAAKREVPPVAVVVAPPKPAPVVEEKPAPAPAAPEVKGPDLNFQEPF